MAYVKRNKRMDWTDAIVRVLAEEGGGPMSVEDITNKIIDKKYYCIDSNNTSKQSVNRYLSVNKDNLFERVRRGVYKLKGTPAPHTTAGRVAPVTPVTVRPCTSYSPGDPKYKRASDFVDSPILSQLEKELLELIVNFPLPLANGEVVCFADILDDLEVQILDEEKSRPQSVDANRLRKKYDELMGKIERIYGRLQNDPKFMDKWKNISLVAEKVRGLRADYGDQVILLPSYLLLGKFVSGKEKESKPKVVIYLKSIEKSINNNESRWDVMAGVFVHEMFHAWNYFNAGQMSGSVLAIDEPMVEFETLYFLKELEAYTHSKAHSLCDEVSRVRKNRASRVQGKQLSIGDVAAYGFGYYLFDKLSKSDVKSITWIETYSKKSASINDSESDSDQLVKQVGDALIPIYPFMSEDKVMKWFEKIIFYGQATSMTVGKSAAAAKVGSDVSLRDLVLACIKIIGRKCFAAQELYAFAPIFKVCVPQYQNLENALKQQLDGLVNEGILDALPHDCYGMKLEDVEVKSKIPAPVPTPPTLVPAPTKSKGGYTKDPSIPFAVEFPDGVKIAEKNAVETFIKSLQKIGLSKVQQHAGIIISGYNLVSDVERPPEGETKKWQHYVDTKYIYTKLSNPVKIKFLYQIAEKFKINIKIYDI